MHGDCGSAAALGLESENMGAVSSGQRHSNMGFSSKAMGMPGTGSVGEIPLPV